MKQCLNCMSEIAENANVCAVCGWNGEENEEGCLPAGSILQGRYIIGTCRGIRCADIQYIAWDALFSQKVFIMEYFPEEIAVRSLSGQVQVEEANRELMQRSIQCFMRQKDKLILLDGTHGLLNVLAGFEENGTAYMVMEWPGERTLRDVLEEEGTWSLAKTERLIKNLVKPLAAAYQSKMLHGQLSMDCCYLTAKGNFKLGFFNEALFFTETDPDYQKEQAQRSVDCFELAHIIGAALVGIDLWQSQPVDDSLDSLADKLPECAVDVLVDALNEDFSRRIESPKLFLDRFMDEVTVEVPKIIKGSKTKKQMNNTN